MTYYLYITLVYVSIFGSDPSAYIYDCKVYIISMLLYNNYKYIRSNIQPINLKNLFNFCAQFELNYICLNLAINICILYHSRHWRDP